MILYCGADGSTASGLVVRWAEAQRQLGLEVYASRQEVETLILRGRGDGRVSSTKPPGTPTSGHWYSD